MSSTFRNSLLIPNPDRHTIRKVPTDRAIGHDLLTQKRIHSLAQQVLRAENNFDILRAPCLPADGMSSIDYSMERVDTSYPIFPRENECMSIFTEDQRATLQTELLRFWVQMWDHGFAPWGFDLFYQPDGSVVLLDFDKFAFRRTNETWGPLALELPFQAATDLLESFFDNPCFPPNFEDRLAALHGLRVRVHHRHIDYS